MRTQNTFYLMLIVFNATAESSCDSLRGGRTKREKNGGDKKNHLKDVFHDFLQPFVIENDRCSHNKEMKFYDEKTCVQCAQQNGIRRSFLCSKKHAQKTSDDFTTDLKTLFAENEKCSKGRKNIMFYNMTSGSCQHCTDFKSNLFCASNRFNKELEDEFNKIHELQITAVAISVICIVCSIALCIWLCYRYRQLY